MQWKYTPEMTQWIRDNCAGVEWESVAENFNRFFGTDKTARQLRACAHDNDIHNGIYHQQPRKGRYRPVGSTRLDKDGYVVIKIADPCKWRRAQLVEWEKYHKPIDIRKDMLIFLDGNRQNYHIDNLYKLPRRLIAIFNRHFLWAKITPETIESVVAIAEMLSARWQAEIRIAGGYNEAMARKNRQHYLTIMQDPVRREERRKQCREYQRRPEIRARRLERQRERRRLKK